MPRRVLACLACVSREANSSPVSIDYGSSKEYTTDDDGIIMRRASTSLRSGEQQSPVPRSRSVERISTTDLEGAASNLMLDESFRSSDGADVGIRPEIQRAMSDPYDAQADDEDNSVCVPEINARKVL